MTGKKLLPIFLVLLAFAASYLGKTALQHQKSGNPGEIALQESQDSAGRSYRRIVSLAPSITEILFLLGLGDRVVGVTIFCDYPPEALTKKKIGGYYNPNYEAIIALNPDLVVILTEHEEQKRHLVELGFNVLVSNHESISGILDSISSIGNACGASKKAEAIVSDLRKRVECIKQNADSLPLDTRVMISVGRNMGSDSLRDIYIAGKSGLYNEMIELSGGVNVYDGDVAYPVVSEEGVIRLNPEVIIDMVPDLARERWDEATIKKEWDVVSRVDAVKNGRVYVFGQDYVVVPGPRFILILEDMARVIHPHGNLD